MPDEIDDAFFRHVCNHTELALIATDDKFRIAYWNHAASRLFGGSADAMHGQLLSTIVPADRRAVADRLLQRALLRREPSTFEFPHHRPDGSPMFLAVDICPIVDDGGNTLGVSVCARDVTRRIQSERALADAGKMTALGTMAGALAHHFNNLLGGLVTRADFAQSSDNPETLRRALASIVSTLSRTGKLTQALLAFAEGDTVESETAEVHEAVRQFLDDLRPRLASVRIRLESRIETVPCRLPIRRIRTLLDCLTTNACEAMPDGGTLRVELLKPSDADEFILRLADTGLGMSEDTLRHAFEPFYTTKSDGTPGSPDHPGLGLAVVHGIARALGGTVTLASQPGRGTTCTVHLPLPPSNKT